jgi:hypothetical protein
LPILKFKFYQFELWKVHKVSIALKNMFQFSNPESETTMIYYSRLMGFEISYAKQ